MILCIVRELRVKLSLRIHIIHVLISRNDLKLSSDDKKNIGLKCKRLIDYGRMQYLKKHGYQSELFYYVDSGVTLEDVVLLAKKQY